MRQSERHTASMVRNPEYHQKTKHIDVKYNFIRDQHEKGTIKMEYVPKGDQLADILTKPLAGPRFNLLRERIGLKSKTLKLTTAFQFEGGC